MNILLITHESQLTIPLRTPIAETYAHLVKRGHEVYGIIYTNKIDSIMEDSWRGIRIIYFPRKRRIFSRISLIRYIQRTIKERKIDIVKVRNDVVGALSIFSALKIMRNPPKLVFQYTWPTHLIKNSKTANTTLKNVFKLADLILPISTYLGEYIIQKFKVSSEKVFPLPSGVNQDLFNPYRYRSVKISEGLPKVEKIILYVGRIDKNRRLEIILNIVKNLLEMGVDVGGVLVGKGDAVTELKERSKRLGIEDKILFTGLIDYHEIPRYTAASDLCLSLLPPTPLHIFSSPIKLFEYMAMEKPVIANKEIPEHRRVLEASKGGLLVEYNLQDITEKALKILTDHDKAFELGKNGRKWTLENRTYKILAERLEEKYDKLIISGKS